MNSSMKKAIILLSLIVAFSYCLFWRHHGDSTPKASENAAVTPAAALADAEATSRLKVSEDAAVTLAAALANAEASARFGVSPFSASQGQVMIEKNKWIWTAMKGYGYGDLHAEVSYTIAQSQPIVEVSQRVIDRDR